MPNLQTLYKPGEVPAHGPPPNASSTPTAAQSKSTEVQAERQAQALLDGMGGGTIGNSPSPGRKLAIFLIALVIMIGVAAAAVTMYASRIAVQPDSTVVVPTTQASPTTEPAPTGNPNAGLPEATLAAIAEWPATSVKTVAFKPGTATPASVSDSEAVYDAVASYASRYPGIAFTLAAYAENSESALNLAAFRLDYLASQLAENRINRSRIKPSTQSVEAYGSPQQADGVEISRSLFSGESPVP